MKSLKAKDEELGNGLYFTNSGVSGRCSLHPSKN
jgi:hypothetical protein